MNYKDILIIKLIKKCKTKDALMHLYWNVVDRPISMSAYNNKLEKFWNKKAKEESKWGWEKPSKKTVNSGRNR